MKSSGLLRFIVAISIVHCYKQNCGSYECRICLFCAPVLTFVLPKTLKDELHCNWDVTKGIT